jgi:hypothetical protein
MLRDPYNPTGVGLKIGDPGVEVITDCLEEGEKLAGVPGKPEVG